MSRLPGIDPELWREDLRFEPKLGCHHCPDFRSCGGLRIPAAAFDCTDFCDCKEPSTCDRACRRSPHFVRRVNEVGGLDLTMLPSLPTAPIPDIHGHAPLLYHGGVREQPCSSALVALPFFKLFYRDTGQPKFSTREQLAEYFRFSPEAVVVVSTTETDIPLERWWSLKEKQSVYENLLALDIKLVTSPNYSVLNNVPYWDNAHNKKRIALSWLGFGVAGIPCALHINAHRNADYEDWKRLLQHRHDISALSVEFGTGMGHPARIKWHVEQLCQIADIANRPLLLVARGALPYLSRFQKSFRSILFIDTDPFLRTIQRSRAVLGNDFSILWKFERTESGVMLDDRLGEAIKACQKNFSAALSGLPVSRRAPRPPNHRDDKTLNFSGSGQMSLFLPYGSAIPGKGMIAGSKAKKAI